MLHCSHHPSPQFNESHDDHDDHDDGDDHDDHDDQVECDHHTVMIMMGMVIVNYSNTWEPGALRCSAI